MDLIQAIVLGVVQGLTEFLPISSSAHQLVVSRLFFGNDGGGATFTAVNQLGTELAVVIYFAKDIWRILSQWCLALVGKVPRDDPDARMGWLVIFGSIPIGVLGFFFADQIRGPVRNLWVTATMLLVFGLVIAVADATARQTKNLEDLDTKDGLKFGLFQALALIPGVSRSGGTIAGGLFMGYKREAAARYSFLLAIPAVFASGASELMQMNEHPNPDGWTPIIVSTLIALAVGYAVIAWLMKYITTHDFKPFVIYRVALAIVLFVLLGFGIIDAAPPVEALTH